MNLMHHYGQSFNLIPHISNSDLRSGDFSHICVCTCAVARRYRRSSRNTREERCDVKLADEISDWEISEYAKRANAIH